LRTLVGSYAVAIAAMSHHTIGHHTAFPFVLQHRILLRTGPASSVFTKFKPKGPRNVELTTLPTK